MAYDAADGYVVALGLNDTGVAPYWGNYSDTWTYNGAAWTKISPLVSPPNRNEASMTYDAGDRCVVLFGGWPIGPGPHSGALNDTWTFANGTWTNRTSTHAPSPRGFASMVWDTSDNYLLLYGGFGAGGNNSGNLTDSWSYSAGVWTFLGSSVYPPFEGALAYDSHDGYVVHFGGTTVANYVTNFSRDTWKFHAGTWQNLTSLVRGAPSGRAYPMFSDDPSVGGALLFGGFSGSTATSWLFSNDSWAYSNLTWTLLSAAAGPSPRYMGQMVFDTAQNATILFGGTNLTAWYTDTWKFGAGGNASSGWSQAAPVLRVTHQTIDAGGSVTFSAGSLFGTGAEMFNYTGLPPGCTSADAATLTCVPTAAGTYTVAMTAIVGGGTSVAHASLAVNPALRILSLGSTFPGGPIDLTQTAAISLELSGGAAPFSYTYPTLPSGCAAANSSELRCTPDATGIFPVVAIAVDGFGGRSTATGTILVNPWPTVDSFTASVANVTVGNQVLFHATAGGGTGYLAYSYTGLPAGCVDANRSALACTPTAPGTYTVTVAVLDAVGGHATSVPLSLQVTANERVVPPPIQQGPARTGFTTAFLGGLFLGLLGLVVVAAFLVRRARENSEGRRIVEELGRRGAGPGAPDPTESPPPDDGSRTR